jgi:hypothetical protein
MEIILIGIDLYVACALIILILMNSTGNVSRGLYLKKEKNI